MTGADGDAATGNQPDLAEALPLDRLAAFLADHLGPSPGPPRVLGRPLGGASNITVVLQWGERRLVLRRPPLGQLLPTSHDVLREFRYLSALAGTAVPVPRVVAACQDASLIGAPFYVMEYVEGVTFGSGRLPPRLDTPAQRRRIGQELIRGLAALHRLPWQELGLSGRPESYLQRQLQRWQQQLALSQTRPLPGLDRVTRWLERNLPTSAAASIVHGDYGLHNVIFSAQPPARLLAVLDWEMSTIGDPLADLGWLLRDWGVVPEKGIRNPAKALSALPGSPTKEEMAQLYQRQSGVAVALLPYYEVFAMWKEVIIAEGLYASFLAGTAANPAVERFRTQVPEQVERILERLASLEGRGVP
jgi:aminoglycoside phosphotransferase (APT) family kinase protein